MAGAAAAIIPAAIQGGSGILGSFMGRQNAIEAGNTQRQLQAEANALEVNLSSTAYQRAVNDMRSAGLNPALMYGSGGPASTPSVGVAMTPQEPYPAQGVAMTGQSVANAILQAQSLKQGQQSIDNGYLMQLEQIAKIRAEIANLPTTTGLADLQKQLTAAQAKLADFNARPNSLDQLGTKLLSRFLEALEERYNKRPTPASSKNFFREMGFPEFPLK